MIQDLDKTIEKLLKDEAEEGTELKAATISFDVPDATWRSKLEGLTVNCYLHSVSENAQRRATEPLVGRAADVAIRVPPPVRVDCAYCISAWSKAEELAVLAEHRVLGQVLRLLMANRTIPAAMLQGSLTMQAPPFPSVIAAPDGPKNDPDFWSGLDHPLKPSLNYVVTLALFLEKLPETAAFGPAVKEIGISTHYGEPKLESGPEPFALTPGAAVTFLSGETATFEATPARTTGGTNAAVDLNGHSIQMLVNDVDRGTYTFDSTDFAGIANASPADIAAVLNREFSGIRALVDGGALVVRTDRQGNGAKLEITETPDADPPVLDLDAAIPGTGNVGDIEAVTAAEAKAVFEAAFAAAGTAHAVEVDGDVFRITHPTDPIQVDAASSAAVAVLLGFDTDPHPREPKVEPEQPHRR